MKVVVTRHAFLELLTIFLPMNAFKYQYIFYYLAETRTKAIKIVVDMVKWLFLLFIQKRIFLFIFIE